MITKQYYDIGVAVSTDDGLLVPFVEIVTRKTLQNLKELLRLSS